LGKDIVKVGNFPKVDLLAAFLRGDLPALFMEREGRVVTEAPPPTVLIPGAFNPLHEGHLALAEVARQILGAPAAFELSLANVDKPLLTPEELGWRVKQFRRKHALWLTKAPTFAEKAKLFPGVVFVVGVDTAFRIVSPRYHDQNKAALAEALAVIRDRGCSFLVAGRVDGSGQFLHLDKVAIPPAFRDLFRAIPEQVFRVDISSTQLRFEK
jgi:hypothetical protein